MTKQFIINKDAESIFLINSESGEEMASLKIKDWETKFFKKKSGELNINLDIFCSLKNKTLKEVIDSFILSACECGYELIELHLDVMGIKIVPALEECGFRLVDTRITFITLIEKKNIEKFPPKIGKIHFATKNNLNDLLALTQQSFSNNPAFHSRFINRTYFTKEETERYFAAYIKNHLQDNNSLFVVSKIESKIIGYFIYKRAGNYNGKQLYKGILSAVDPEYQGNKLQLSMQSFLYEYFSEEQFYLDNTTQLTNFPVIKNHMRFKKNLNKIILTFYWSKSHTIFC